MDELDLLRIELRKLDELDQMKRLNQELYDQLVGSVLWLMKYSQKNDIILPNQELLVGLLHKGEEIIQKIHERARHWTRTSRAQGLDRTKVRVLSS